MGRYSILVFVFILAFAPFVFADTQTELNVPNAPPEFNGLIPNFSWTGGPLENAFNMNDYFEDLQGDQMVFSVTGNDSIMVNISEAGFVSFYPPANYLGVQVLTFYADDGYGNMPSNFVYLGIGVDMEPPKWYYPTKGKTKIYQNDFVNFTANWTDNFELASYYLSINQGEGWFNYNGVFSGAANRSINNVQISAPVGKIVEWKICANDTSGNEGCTDVYNFAVLKKPVTPGGSSTGTGGSGGDGSSTGGRITGENIKDLYKDTKELVNSPDREDYSVDVDSFLVDLKQGNSLTRVLEITNTGTNELDFDLSISGIEEYITLSVKNFTLAAGETKTVTVDFEANLTTVPGQYFGTLLIKGVHDVVIPLILNVNDANLDFGVNVVVLDESNYVKPGSEVFANINITNKGDQISSDVTLTYAIKDFYGNIYDSEEEVFTLESAVSTEKSLVVPEDILLGKYIFYARISNVKGVAIGSDDFTVGLSFKFQAFLKTSSIFLIVILLSIISIILALRYKNQKAKERALNLYIKLTELKEMIKENKFDKAANLYIAIKRIYGEPISRTILDDKQKLVDEIKKLAGKVDFEDVVEKDSEEIEKKDSGKSDKNDEENKEVVSDEREGKEKDSKEDKKKSDVKEEKKDLKEKIKEKEIENKSKVEVKKENKSDAKNKEVVLGGKEGETVVEKKEKNKEEDLTKGEDKKEEGKVNEKD